MRFLCAFRMVAGHMAQGEDISYSMGSAQSTQSPAAAPSNSTAVNVDANAVQSTAGEATNDTDTNKPKSSERRKAKKNDKASHLTGFDLVQYKCRRKKRRYDTCYRQWYGGTFQLGKIDKDDRDKCDDLFEEYQTCILLGMKKDRERRGLGKAAEDSAIGTFEEEYEV